MPATAGRRLGVAVLAALVVLAASTRVAPGAGHRAAGAPRLEPPPLVRGSLPATPHPSVSVELARLLRTGLPVYCGGRATRYVALTFDDGPGPYSARALRILRRAHARATFFLVGREIRYWPTIPPREARIGELGDHTWTHPELPVLPTSGIREELDSTKRAIASLAHVPVQLFRPPYGQLDARVLRVARELHLVTILWSIDTRDSEGAPWNRIGANVARGIKGGSIILMHENHGQTIRALKFRILPLLAAKHWIPVTVAQLLALDPPTANQLRAGYAGCISSGHASVGGPGAGG